MVDQYMVHDHNLKTNAIVAKQVKQIKLYVIEIFVGGSISNIGIEQPTLKQGNNNGLFTLFFDTQDVQAKWLNYF